MQKNTCLTWLKIFLPNVVLFLKPHVAIILHKMALQNVKVITFSKLLELLCFKEISLNIFGGQLSLLVFSLSIRCLLKIYNVILLYLSLLLAILLLFHLPVSLVVYVLFTITTVMTKNWIPGLSVLSSWVTHLSTKDINVLILTLVGGMSREMSLLLNMSLPL